MATYNAVQWNQSSDITLDDLVQLNENIEYVKERTVPVRWQNSTTGTKVNSGMKILAGRVNIPRGKATQRKIRVNFGDVFSPNSTPICTFTIASGYERYFHTSIQGLNGVQPDRNGMYVFWTGDRSNKNISATMVGNYICIGS